MSKSETQKKWRSNTDKKPVQLYLTNEIISLLDSLVSSNEKASRATVVSSLIKDACKPDVNISNKPDVDIEQFAKEVQQAVNKIPPDVGHGVTGKVYISHAYELCNMNMSLDDFKAKLLEAHPKHIKLCTEDFAKKANTEQGKLSAIKRSNAKTRHYILQSQSPKKEPSYSKADIKKAIAPFKSKPMAASDELNRRGYVREDGKKWTGANVKKWIKDNMATL